MKQAPITAEWIERRLAETGKTRSALAELLGVNPSQITRLLKGERRIQLDELEAIREFLGDAATSPPQRAELFTHYVNQNLSNADIVGPGFVVDVKRVHPQNNPLAKSERAVNVPAGQPINIPVLGKVAAGVWIEVQDVNGEADRASPFPPDPRYPIEAQFDVTVDGTSIDKFAADGYSLRCVDIHRTEVPLVEGDYVLVRRTRDQGALVETTVKRLHRKPGGGAELRAYSSDPRWQHEPIELGSGEEDEVQIQAKVLYAYRPASDFQMI